MWNPLYWACRFQIGADETIDIVEATANGTGYDTEDLALDGLPPIADSHASIGTIVVAVEDAITFTPNTTALNASGIHVTYTDGLTMFEALPGA